MRDADRAQPDQVSKPELCSLLLSIASLTAQLPGDLCDLADAGRTDRVPHTEQAVAVGPLSP